MEKVLILAHSKGIPVLHVNMKNPNFTKEEVENKLVSRLGEFIEKVLKGEQIEKLVLFL